MFASVPMSWLVEVTNTCRLAFERELLASTRRLRLLPSYSAREIETVSAAGAVALIVSGATREEVFKVAVICAVVVELTWVVLIWKFALVAPAATVTVAGTLAAALLLVRRTAVALCGRALKVTVAVAALPPVTELGFKVSAEIVGAVGGTTAPLVFTKTSVAELAPPTSKAMSGLLSPLKSDEIMNMPPTLDCGGGAA